MDYFFIKLTHMFEYLISAFVLGIDLGIIFLVLYIIKIQLFGRR